MWLLKTHDSVKKAAPVYVSSPIPAALGYLARPEGLFVSPATALTQVADLRKHLATVPDPRGLRGIRHTITTILLIAAAAVLTGARSFTAIGE